MTAMSDISPEILRHVLRYEPETGRLFWRRRSVEMFKNDERKTAEVHCRWWNSRYAGREAFTALDSHGYRRGRVMSKALLAHRVIWAICTSAWPNDMIDHQNGVRTDNRFENLREATASENQRNAKRKSTNTTGVTGVSFVKSSGKFNAYIWHDDKSRCLGYFDSIEEAFCARKAAESKLSFHPNHGRNQEVST